LDLTVGDKPTSFVLQLGVKKGFFGNNAQEITGEQFVVCSAKNLSIEFGQDIPKMATNEKEKKRFVIIESRLIINSNVYI
jgi:hypothetical protein